MNQDELDITSHVLKAIEDMKDGDIFLAQGFTLYDSMSATELFDKKIDIKMGLDVADTPKQMLAQGLIQLSEHLTEQQVIGIYDLVLSKEMLWYKGNALPQTIYTLVQQYDDTLTKGNAYIDTLFKSMNSIGQVVYQIIKNGPYLREEDYIPSILSFRTDTIPLSTMILDHLNPLDASTTAQLKKKKTLTAADALSARLKLRKALAHLVQRLSLPYSAEQHTLIMQQIEIARKRIDIIKQTFHFSDDVSQYESKTIFKHIRAMISQRGVLTLSKEATIEALENMLHQVEVVLQIAHETNFFRIFESIDDLIHQNPKNTVVRAYLESNLFKNDLFFNHTPLPIKGMLTAMFPICAKEFQSTNPEVVTYFEYLNSISQEYIIKMLRGTFRQMRDFHKIYQHFSILIHESTKTDQLLFKGTRSPLMVFTYELALRMMIKQLTLGFPLNLYDQCDYQFIFFQLDYLLIILDKNRNNCLNFIPQQSLQALVNKNKKKKLVTDIQETLFHEISYWKGLQLLFKAYARMCFILTDVGVIQNPQKDDVKYRYSNRLRIFEQCYYIKPVTYDEFIVSMKEVYKDETHFVDGINQCQSLLKEALEQFKLIPADEKLCPSWMVDQQKKLQKICVITSVSLMRIKLAGPKLNELKVSFSDLSQIPHIPQLDIV